VLVNWTGCSPPSPSPSRASWSKSPARGFSFGPGRARPGRECLRGRDAQRTRRPRSAIASARRFIMRINYRNQLSSFREPRTPSCHRIKRRPWLKYYAARANQSVISCFRASNTAFATIQRCLDSELHFYAIEVFKISLTF
jgi:hypothetical protein